MEIVKSQPKLQEFNLDELLKYALANPEADIYYHPHCTWWTHSPDDFHQKTDEQFETQKSRLQAIIDNPETPQDKIEMVKGLLATSISVRNSGRTIPVAPDDCPLLMNNIIDFISRNMDNTERCGKFGIHTLMAAHHRNCGGLITKKWADLDEFAEPEFKANRYPHPETMSGIMALIAAHKLSKAKPEKKAPGLTIVRELPKIGRNDACLCGSGKKYKYCHGAN